MSADRARSAERDLRRARTRITAITVVLLVAVLLIGAVSILSYSRRQLVDEADTRLRRSGRAAAAFVGSEGVRLNRRVEASPVQLVDADGAVLYAAGGLAGAPPLWVPGEPRGPSTVDESPLGAVRVGAFRFGDRWIVFAEPLRPIDRSVASLRDALLVVLPIVALLLGALVWWAVGRALRPVAAARAREEQLLADVSHELRSPITGIRVLLETEPSEPDELVTNRRSALVELSRLETITEQLMQLTADRHHVSVVSPQPVDLDEVVQREAERFAVRDVGPIDVSGVQPGQVIGVEAALESMVDNLLSNAVRHASGSVAAAVTEHRDVVELTVDDDGPGIPVAERETVFGRFTRLDEARTRADGGAGLGLAIVRAVVDAHRGTIAIEDSPLGGARVVVRLPASTRS